MTSKPFVFVAMPFRDRFSDVYELGIKPACEAAGAVCQRVDEQIYRESIPVRIHQQIEAAHLVIAEVTEPNLNVYYEVGYARGRGKDVILLTERVEERPFDLASDRHLVYEGKITKLQELLEPMLAFFLKDGGPSNCPIPVEGSWAGHITPQNPDPVAASVSLNVDLRWRGRLEGRGEMDVPGFGLEAIS